MGVGGLVTRPAADARFWRRTAGLAVSPPERTCAVAAKCAFGAGDIEQEKVPAAGWWLSSCWHWTPADGIAVKAISPLEHTALGAQNAPSARWKLNKEKARSSGEGGWGGKGGGRPQPASISPKRPRGLPRIIPPTPPARKGTPPGSQPKRRPGGPPARVEAGVGFDSRPGGIAAALYLTEVQRGCRI